MNYDLTSLNRDVFFAVCDYLTLRDIAHLVSIDQTTKNIIESKEFFRHKFKIDRPNLDHKQILRNNIVICRQLKEQNEETQPCRWGESSLSYQNKIPIHHYFNAFTIIYEHDNKLYQNYRFGISTFLNSHPDNQSVIFDLHKNHHDDNYYLTFGLHERVGFGVTWYILQRDISITLQNNKLYLDFVVNFDANEIELYINGKKLLDKPFNTLLALRDKPRSLCSFEGEHAGIKLRNDMYPFISRSKDVFSTSDNKSIQMEMSKYCNSYIN